MYQLKNYLEMMTDRHRMVPLEAAIRSQVRPGDVVLDLGAGTGVLSFIALDAGAAHVFALDLSPNLEVARQVARGNGLAERITFIQADARTVVLPGRVDGMIGDVRGTLPLLGDNIDLFRAVRERWLKTGGYTIPLADEIFVAPVSAVSPRHQIDGWLEPRPEARYDAAAALAANHFIRAYLDPENVLSAAQSLGSIHYDGETPKKLVLETSFVIDRTATVTGLGLWFRGTLTREITFDTSPSSPDTIYGHAFLPLDTSRRAKEGEAINVRVAVHRMPSDPIWTWSVAAAGSSGWRENHSTFRGKVLGRGGADWLAGTKSPALSDDGLLARHVLAAMDGKKTARQLAEQLTQSFPGRFGAVEEALPEVMKLLGRYASP